MKQLPKIIEVIGRAGAELAQMHCQHKVRVTTPNRIRLGGELAQSPGASWAMTNDHTYLNLPLVQPDSIIVVDGPTLKIDRRNLETQTWVPLLKPDTAESMQVESDAWGRYSERLEANESERVVIVDEMLMDPILNAHARGSLAENKEHIARAFDHDDALKAHVKRFGSNTRAFVDIVARVMSDDDVSVETKADWLGVPTDALRNLIECYTGCDDPSARDTHESMSSEDSRWLRMQHYPRLRAHLIDLGPPQRTLIDIVNRVMSDRNVPAESKASVMQVSVPELSLLLAININDI